MHFVKYQNGWSGRATVLGNFQYWDVSLVWSIVGQGTTVFAVGASGVVWIFLFFVFHISFISPSLWEIVSKDY